MVRRGEKGKKGQATKGKSEEQEVDLVVGDPDKSHPDKVDKANPDKVDRARKARSSRARRAPQPYRDEDYQSPLKSPSKTGYVDCIYFV